jgi:hypothetical protein
MGPRYRDVGSFRSSARRSRRIRFLYISIVSNILASSPKDFENCWNLVYAAESKTPFTVTKSGLQIELPIVAVNPPELPYGYDSSNAIQGWVGVLNCLVGGALEFVGIILRTLPGQRQSAQAERIRYGDAWSQLTVRIGPRAACQVVRSKVTIIQGNETQTALNSYYSVRHFIINESQALLDIGTAFPILLE